MTPTQTHKFAESVFDTNSAHELRNCLQGLADGVDCITWGISPGQWFVAVKAALVCRMSEDADLDHAVDQIARQDGVVL